MDTTLYDERHAKMLRPVVRIATSRGSGSGTVIYSAETPEGFSNYVLTNYHVVGALVTFEERWSALRQRNVKAAVTGVPEVHFFQYAYRSRAVGYTNVESDIVAYDKDEDLALLKLRGGLESAPKAALLPKGEEVQLRAGMHVQVIGAAMGVDPVVTAGMLSQFNIEIDNREYWLTSAPTIFGNSGGALFLTDSMQLIGVPSKVGVSLAGFGPDPITHMSYAIPITRVYKFLEDQVFNFIFDPTHTEAGDAEQRKLIRDREERRLAAAESMGKKEE